MKYIIQITDKGLYFTNKENMSELGEFIDAVLFSEVEKAEIEKCEMELDYYVYSPISVSNENFISDIADELEMKGYAINEDVLDDIQQNFKEVIDEVVSVSKRYGEAVRKIAERITSEIEAK